MFLQQRRNPSLLLTLFSISFLGASGFGSTLNGRYCFPVQRRIERLPVILPFEDGRISRTLHRRSPSIGRQSRLMVSPVESAFNDKGALLGFLDVESFANSGRIAQSAFFWSMLQEDVEVNVATRTAEVVAFGVFSSFLIILGSLLFTDRDDADLEIPKNADPDAYRRAKSGLDLLDPDRKWDDLYLNYNELSGPFGFKKNAEIWNGRVAMLSFIWVVAQEVATDKGILNSLRNGESSAVTALACFLTLVGGFTSILVSADEEEKDFVERVVSKEALQKNAADPNWRPETVKKPYYAMKPSSVAQVSDPLTYDDYIRRSNVMKSSITKPPERSSPEPTRHSRQIEQSGAESSTGNQPVSYQIIPPKTPSPLWSAQQRPQRRPRTYANIVEEGRRNPLPAFSVPAAKPLVVRALENPYERSARLPVSELRLFDKTDLEVEIQKISDAYDTSRWSLELAELWNGRFAQIAFVVVFAQETVQRKGVLRGIEQSNPTNLVGLLSVFLAMVGVGAAFTVGVGESQVSTRAPAVLYADRTEGAVETTEETVDASSFKVDGYRFKKETPTTIAIGYASPHPEGNFHFNADNSNAIREGAGIPARKPDPSNYKVDGYRFKPNTPTTIAIGDTSPHPEGSFSFNDENTDAIQSSEQQPSNEPDPSNFKVGGYRFKESTQSAIHPGGNFHFGDETSSAIQIGAGIPIEPVEAQPPKDTIPHPVKSFVFGPENEPVIKSATRNTSVPSPNEFSSSSYDPNDRYEYSPAYTSTPESLSATSNGYIPPPNYELSEYTRNGQEQAVQQNDETSSSNVVEQNPVYVGVNGATNQYLDSLSARWEE